MNSKKRARAEDDIAAAAAPQRVVSVEGLRAFYLRLWLPHAAHFVLRELATLAGGCAMEQREIVLQMYDFPHRHCIFRNMAEVITTLEQMVREGRPPVNIHFGPVYAAPHLALSKVWPPNKRDVVPEFAPNTDLLKPRAFERSQRPMTLCGELILDCDMDDKRRVAAAICDCGTDKRVCQRCWTHFMLPAQRIITYVLRDFYKFTRFFTVFSGRRGFHVWLMERHVLRWTGWERQAFMQGLLAPSKVGADLHTPLADFVWETVLEPLSDGRSRADTFAALYPALDADVATQPGHLHKLPLMLNANTGLFCDVLADPDDEQYRFVASPTQIRQLTLGELEPDMMRGCVAYLQRVLDQ